MAWLAHNWALVLQGAQLFVLVSVGLLSDTND